MKPVFRSEEVRLIENNWMKTQGLSSMDLILEASQAIATFCLKLAQESKGPPRRVLVLRGPGKNGEDARQSARLLASEWPQTEFLHLEFKKISTQDIFSLSQSDESRVDVKSLSLDKEDWILDGVYGLGFRGDLPQEIQKIFRVLNQSRALRISIDLPTGSQADTGRVSKNCFQADHTLCLGVRKVASVHGEALAYSGKIHFLKMSFTPKKSQIYQWTLRDTLKNLPTRAASSHKGQGGRVLCLARDGALVLAGEAAQRIGASGVLLVEQALALKTWLREFPDWMIWRTHNFFETNAVLIGPNWGFSKEAQAQFEKLRAYQGPVVCDADALRMLARSENLKLNPNWVLTPHLGELSQLISKDPRWILENPILALRDAHQKTDAIILMKGFKTWIFDGKRYFVISTGNRSLAKAGSGDVLSGMIVGLMAQGFPPVKAAVVAASLHGHLGDEHIKKRRDYLSLRSYDLIQALPEALHRLRGFKLK